MLNFNRSSLGIRQSPARLTDDGIFFSAVFLFASNYIQYIAVRIRSDIFNSLVGSDSEKIVIIFVHQFVYQRAIRLVEKSI